MSIVNSVTFWWVLLFSGQMAPLCHPNYCSVSWNHTMVWVKKDPKGYLVPTPHAVGRGHLSLDKVTPGLEHFQGEPLPMSPGNLFHSPVFFDVHLASCGSHQNLFAKITFHCWSDCCSVLELPHCFSTSHHIWWPVAQTAGCHLQSLTLLIRGWQTPSSFRQACIFLPTCS